MFFLATLLSLLAVLLVGVPLRSLRSQGGGNGRALAVLWATVVTLGLCALGFSFWGAFLGLAVGILLARRLLADVALADDGL